MGVGQKQSRIQKKKITKPKYQDNNRTQIKLEKTFLSVIFVNTFDQYFEENGSEVGIKS
jgi:hypothetical protein